ncbi:MAG TPA: DUF429 domain-containing protein [Burkholderiaceae bacterium]|nr:DUF429 domain-containing protein [Burkholderiaceae bacterium]
MRIIGVDFTSAPSRRKPITWASASFTRDVLQVDDVELMPTFDAFEAALIRPGPWTAGFDLPFGLPRELVDHLGWPARWDALIRHFAGLARDEIRATFQAFCAARPVGAKFAHRRTDGPAGSSPSMKWVNPPVAYMLHAGAPRLLAAGVHVPGLHLGDASRVALEAYPGYLARRITSKSYKSDEAAKQTPERAAARALIVDALLDGAFGIPVALSPAMARDLRNDGSADRLDAVLCAVQAARALAMPRYGLPENVDPVEGWIAGVPDC